MSSIEVLHGRTVSLRPEVVDRVDRLSLCAMFVGVLTEIARKLIQVQPTLVLLFPREVLVVQIVIGVQLLQVGGELLGRRVIPNVYEGVVREEGGAVCPAQDDRHDVQPDHPEQFLRDVFVAETVLEGHVELVALLKHLWETKRK